MKKIALFSFLIVSTPSAYTQSFRLEPIPSVTIPVTVDKMTNLVFPEAIQSGVKVSADILAQKVHGVDNVIEIKALRRHFTATNITAYGRDGRLYSFVLHYVDDSSILNFRILPVSGAPILLSDLPATEPQLRKTAYELEIQPSKNHCSTRSDHITLRLSGSYVKDSLEWLTFKMSNRSALAFHPETIRFYLQDRKQLRRRAFQEVDIQPLFQDIPALIGPQAVIQWATAFTPFHIDKGKRLKCQFRGKDGRMLVLTIKNKMLHRL